MPNLTNRKKAFDEAIANMALVASPFSKNYVFYMHLISQCRVIFTSSLPAAAGVTFKHDHYVLYLNPSEVITEGVDKNGNPFKVQGFHESMPLKHRIGILKHEMLHICLGHLLRTEDRNFRQFNYATDCALNQEILRDHLPSYAIYPDNFPSTKKVPLKESAEVYYELLDEENKENKGEKGDDNQSDNLNSQNSSNPSNSPMVDDHSTWKEIEGDKDLQTELTKSMLENAAKNTQKSRGDLPQDYAQMIENLTINREVNWKQVLRTIVGNKKANTRKTLMRRDRRLPFANWIKGKQKDRIFELAVISDVSGSVSDEALKNLWGEIIHICELFSTPVNIVQVDTEPSTPQVLTSKTRVLNRTACGGTYLSPGIQMFRENNMNFDALVVTTDNFISQDDVNNFLNLKIPVIWLVSAEGAEPLEGQNSGRHKYIKLSVGDNK